MASEAEIRWGDLAPGRSALIKASILAFLAWALANYDFLLFGTVLPVIQKSFGWSDATATAVNTAVSLGAALVMLTIGGIAVDRIGRRAGMMVTVGGTALSSALTSIVPGAVLLVIIRSFSGLGLAEQGVNATYLNELYAATDDAKVKRRRGFVYSFVQSGYPVGAVIAAAFAAGLIPLIGWRLTFLVATFPAILLVFFRRSLKESPHYTIQRRVRALQKEGKADEAAKLASSYGIEVEKSRTPLTELFKRDSIRSTISLGIAWFTNWFGILVFSVLGTSLLTIGKGISFDNALIYVVIANAVGLVGYIFHGWVGDRLGRRNVTGVSWIISAIVFGIMTLGVENHALVLVLFAVGTFFEIGPYSAFVFFNSECYKTHCRATGVNFLSAVSQVGAVVAGVIVTTLLASGHEWPVAAFWVGAVGIFISALAIFGARRVEVLK